MKYYARVHALQYVGGNTEIVIPAERIDNAMDDAVEINRARGGFAGNAWGGAQWVADYDGPFETYEAALGAHQRAMDHYLVIMKYYSKAGRAEEALLKSRDKVKKERWWTNFFGREPYRLSYAPEGPLVG